MSRIVVESSSYHNKLEDNKPPDSWSNEILESATFSFNFSTGMLRSIQMFRSHDHVEIDVNH